MKNIVSIFLSFLLLASFSVSAQKGSATISGQVRNEAEDGMPQVSVSILGSTTGITTNDSGFFTLKVPAGKAFALLFTYTGYQTFQQNFLLADGEQEVVTIRLERSGQMMDEVVVKEQRGRTEAGLIRVNPKAVLNLPTPVTGVESLIKIFVGSNNELTSQYNVRGGSYDENLIYVNDFEIFRPYLVRSGQQEGLSFINPAMVRHINFYNGGFQARYGDKMSSVLDIQYNTPQKFGGSAYVSLLEQGAHAEGISQNKKLSYIVGVRNRSNENLLSSQPTEGAYVPSSSDAQALLSYRFSPIWSTEVLGNVSSTRFSFAPSYTQLTSAVFSPFFTSSVGMDIYFEGQEKDAYSTQMLGVSTTYQPTQNLKLKWLLSTFQNKEEENIDIAGAYLFGDRDFDQTASTFGTIVNPLGAGVYHNYARNNLTINNFNLSHKGVLNKNKHVLQWGLGWDKTDINDGLNEWEYVDSAGYSLPYNPAQLLLQKVVRSNADLSINKFNAYLQDNILFQNAFTLQGGVRLNYNDLNGELLISPRIGASWQPQGEKDIVLRAAAGAYHQPPFYRELRRYNGSLNTDVIAQKSWQAVAGIDYNFTAFNRVLRFTTEGYYKYMTDVVPYDIDNVRIRYFGENGAKAYAAGVEMRLFGEIVKDAESWISLGLMKTAEDIEGDVYKNYTLNERGQPTDSTTVQMGWLRRPTDRLFTFGMFFQDYLATNKNFKMFLNTLYGSKLPYNIPGSVKYRNALRIDPYIRVDIGFSALLLDSERGNRRSRSPFRNFDNIWASLEVFNLIDRSNTISYLLVKDFANNTFTMPNRLTPRLLNFKIVARW